MLSEIKGYAFKLKQKGGFTLYNLKIGITGSQGTGKSTLAKRLAEELDLNIVTEQARKSAKVLGLKKLPNPKESPALSRAFQKLCLQYQLEEEGKYNSFVSDRTTIDNALYYLVNNSVYSSPKENMDYYRRCLENAQTYNLVVYVPIEFPLEGDGFRNEDAEVQAEHDFLVRCLLKEIRPDFITVTGTVEERVRQVVQKLRKGDL